MEEEAEQNPAQKAIILLRSRICNPNFVFTPFSNSQDSNYSKLKFIISNSITEACNNSILLLGPRGCGKIAVLDLVLRDLNAEYTDMISVVRLNGLLHSDDISAVKEISRQLCLEHRLSFSKMASFDENSQFMIDMLRECGLAHKTVIFVLNEFDLFTQGKQRLLYSLLDAMQSLTSQAVVIGVSCRLDADQLLEKRVRSRFSHRKLLFAPPSTEDLQRLLEHILCLPTDSTFPHNYAIEFNEELHKIFNDQRFKEIFYSLSDVDTSVSHLLKFLFHVTSSIDVGSGFLSHENFKNAALCIQRQPKLESVLEYKSIHDSYQTSDYYAQNVCLRAFEHLLERELISFTDNRGQSIEFRPVKLLISPYELHQGLKSNRACPDDYGLIDGGVHCTFLVYSDSPGNSLDQ